MSDLPRVNPKSLIAILGTSHSIEKENRGNPLLPTRPHHLQWIPTIDMIELL
jgi:hypothetical protein